MLDYTKINSETWDLWAEDGCEYTLPISHEEYEKITADNFSVILTPCIAVPHEWFGDLKGKKLLGLASGGGQQIPIFSVLGADCTVLDYSSKQCESEKMVAMREGYEVNILQLDMTNPLPFADETFDIIFHPVSNCYIEKVEPVFKECYRVLKKGGILLSGLDNGVNFLVDEDEKTIINRLPFNPLLNESNMKQLIDEDCGVQFSHTMEEQIGGQLKAGFTLVDIYEDTNGAGYLHELNIPSFIATKSIKF